MAQRSGRSKDQTKSARPTQIADGLSDIFVAELQAEILDWYAESGRDLPWRRTRDPYAILVSELMLQQTQAPRVIPKYEAFLARFPDAARLAHAQLGEVLTLWSGLGYNRRAQYLHRAAQYIMGDLGGEFPRTKLELQKLPGVGDYTAGAVAAFAFDEDVVILETNIRRIYQLILAGDDVTDQTHMAIGERLLPQAKAAIWYHALMDLGTLVRAERGAASQQQRLRELFPLLDEMELPRLANEPLLRPRQSRFADSNRYFRGQIVKRLSSAEELSLLDLSTDLDISKVERALHALLKEGLILHEPFSDLYRLP